jgi:hypothetical protein
MPIILGLLMILFGFFINYTPRLYVPSVSDINLDFAGFNLSVGIFMIVVGVVLIWTSLRDPL